MDVALRSDGRDKRFFVTPLGGKDHLVGCQVYCYFLAD